MKAHVVDGKLVVQRTSQEKAPFVQRLNRVEGQIRGLRQMIEDNRYCGDAVQQTSAVIAAVREVALMLISQQLQNQLDVLGEPDKNDVLADAKGMDQFIEMLRSTYRFQ